ncbi:MAG: Transposase, partial [Candidatus Alkanophagales archaeon MCA70_species_2]|nr:Transposase [Candidatus Alkanophaga liquidiphilum]
RRLRGRAAGILSELHPVSKTSVRNWIKKRNLKRSYRLRQRKKRNLVASDETVVKARRKKYYVYSAVDVERNELIMRVYTTRNYLTKVFKGSARILRE